MPHPQPRVAAVVRVGPGPAPVLLQEHPQPGLRALPVVGRVHRPEDGVLAHPGVEARDEGTEGGLPADLGVEGARRGQRWARLAHATDRPSVPDPEATWAVSPPG